MFGADINTLRIKSWTEVNGVEDVLFSHTGQTGDYWERIDVILASSQDFQVGMKRL